MIKTEDIKNIRFSKKIFGGYDSESVDSFVDNIQKLLMWFEEENNKLKEKIISIEFEIEKYKEDEANIRRAISNSQKIADAAILDAGVRSKYIIQDVNEKASKLISVTKNNVKNKLDVSKRLFDYFVNFKSKFKKNLKENMDFLDTLNFEDTSEIEKYLKLIEEQEIKFIENENNIFKINDSKLNEFSFESKKDITSV